MKTFVMRNSLPAFLALIVVLVAFPFFESISRIYSNTVPAIEWHGVEVITKVVQPGDNLELLYSATINKQCPSDLRGFVVASDGTVPIRFPTVAGGYAMPSEKPVEIRVRLQLPKTSDNGLAPLQTGEYIYRTISTRYCPNGVEYDNNIPDAKFSMEVRR